MSIIYVKRNTASHLFSAQYVLNETAAASANTSVSMSTSGIWQYWDTPANQPNILTWQGGTYTWRLRVMTANSAISIVAIELARYSSGGTLRASKIFPVSVSCGTTGVKSGTVTWNDGTQNPSGAAQSDIFELGIEFDSTSMSQSLTYGQNLTSGNDEINTPLSASTLRNLTATLSDSLTITHTSIDKIRTLNQARSDTVTLTHTSTNRVRTLNKTRTDILTITHTDTIQSKIRNLARTISESLVFNDVRGTVRNRVRTRTDSLGLIHTNTQKIEHKIRTVIAQGIALGETLQRQRNKLRSQTGSLSFSETNVNTIGKSREISDNLTFGFSNSTVRNRVRTLDNQIISLLLDTMIRQRLLQRQITQSLNLSEIMIKTTSTRFRTLTDNINLSGISEAIKTKLRTIQDTLTLEDLSTRAFVQRIKTIDDSLSLGSSVTKLGNKIRGLSDSIILSSQSRKETHRLRLLQEELGLSHLTSKTTNRNRVITDTLGFVHGSIDTVLQRLRMVTQGLTLNDMVETGSAKAKIIYAQLTLEETLLKIRSLNKPITESINLSDMTSRITQRLRTLTDNINISEGLTFLKLKVALVSQQLNLSLTTNRYVDRLRSAQSSLSLFGNISKLRSISRFVPHILTLSDSSIYSTLRISVKTINDSFNLGTDIIKSRARRVSITESLSLQSSLEKRKEALVRMITESIVFNGTVLRGRDIRRTIAQSLSFTEQLLKVTKTAVKSFHLKLSRYRLYRH